MKIKCPCCGAVASLDLLLNAEDGAREAIKAAFAVPSSLGKQLIQYLGLFRPRERELSFSRVATLLNELLPQIESETFERGGKEFSAPITYWQAGIEHMLANRDKLTLPLRSHGYLYEVMMGLDAKSIGLAQKPQPVHKAQSPPPEPAPARIDPDGQPRVMTKGEGRAVWDSLKEKITLRTPQANPEDKEAKRQQMLDELERKAASKQEENHDQ